MAKVILICGKICCGKSYYANQLKTRENAVILSCDEMTSILFDNDLGDRHEQMIIKIKDYLLKKSVELVKANCNVILDWGFWTKKERDLTRKYFNEQNIATEFHYINVDEKTWLKNIEERNNNVVAGKSGSNYYLDEGLKNKLLSMWEEPNKAEIDFWIEVNR